MYSFLRCLLLFLLVSPILVSCKRQSDAPPPTQQLPAISRRLLQDAIVPKLYELPSGALSTWRKYSAEKPTLLLFSSHPLLDPIPDARRSMIRDLLATGSDTDIIARFRMLTNEPVLLPPETLSAALDNDLFAEIVLILPSSGNTEGIDLEKTRNRLLQAGFLSTDEARALALENGFIRGQVRDIPLCIAPAGRLPNIDRKIILHVDLSYFKELYINEVKTPAYDLLLQLTSSLKTAGYNALAATLSYSNQEVGFSLESRFLINDLATLLRDPTMQDKAPPASWTLRAKALYASTMFAESDAQILRQQAAALNPNDPATYHALALDLLAQKQTQKGFLALDKAVELDQGYGLAYLELAERGFTINQTDKSIELLEKSARAIPSNPFIRIELANRLIQAGRVKEARPIIAELRKLNWSKDFFGHVPLQLSQMEDAAAVDVIAPKQPPTSPAPVQPQATPKGRMNGFQHMSIPGH